MHITLKQIEAFVWVADLGSFRRAATRLHTTQPNISARIATLETMLGVILMERDAGSVRLTPRGKALLDHARAVLSATEQLVIGATDETAMDGTLRLGVTELIVHTWLSDFLKALNTRFPKIVVELTIERSSTLEMELANRTIDLAIQNGPFARKISGSAPLETYELVWVAAKSLGLSGRDLTRQALAKHPILTHGRDTRFFLENSAHFEGLNPAARLVPSSNLAACIHMTLNGMGVAALPEAMIKTELGDLRLERLQYPWTPEPLAFFARFDTARVPDFVAEAAEMAAQVAASYN
jgi:DNA-binding transcriptional LysR family regulator